jgi:hydrogenase maturation protease
VAHLIAIIGCGNPTRSDDAAGVEVVRRLAPVLGADPEIRLCDAGTDGMAVMFAARGCTTLVIVDCCRTGGAPGAIFTVPGDALAAAPPPGMGLHGLRWDHALHAGQKMYGAAFPADVTVFLIEGRSTELGLDLSSEVAAAVDDVVARIVELVRARRAPAPGIEIRRGTLHLAAAVYERFFAGLATVVLLREGADLLILPVRDAAAGGYLVKQRNRAGDRVVDAADFFRANGIEDTVERAGPVSWSSERAALVAAGLFAG